MTAVYYKDVLGFVAGVLSVNKRYSDFVNDVGSLTGLVSSEHLDILHNIVSCSLNVDRGFLGICEDDVKSDFYFTNNELVGSSNKLDSDFSCFTTAEFESLKYEGVVCFFKVLANDMNEAFEIFNGDKECIGGIGVVKSSR